ncbi:hypothetical protein SCHPADRAFT_1001923 [Schizopora paradoxa]|uniref:Uncharacterized protein n=1 Tax=Schizopora paradoxa TaxID=27342 RepID=A0A0H2R5G1_9AGAM|nr:hypothetical protein SCHPADRAFT_1001923 [Schizopora paradoxa]
MDVQPPPYEQNEAPTMQEGTHENEEHVESSHCRATRGVVESVEDATAGEVTSAAASEGGQVSVRRGESASSCEHDHPDDEGALARALHSVTLQSISQCDSSPLDEDSVSTTTDSSDSDPDAESRLAGQSSQGHERDGLLPLEDGFEVVEDLMLGPVGREVDQSELDRQLRREISQSYRNLLLKMMELYTAEKRTLESKTRTLQMHLDAHDANNAIPSWVTGF